MLLFVLDFFCLNLFTPNTASYRVTSLKLMYDDVQHRKFISLANVKMFFL